MLLIKCFWLTDHQQVLAALYIKKKKEKGGEKEVLPVSGMSVNTMAWSSQEWMSQQIHSKFRVHCSEKMQKTQELCLSLQASGGMFNLKP